MNNENRNEYREDNNNVVFENTNNTNTGSQDQTPIHDSQIFNQDTASVKPSPVPQQSAYRTYQPRQSPYDNPQTYQYNPYTRTTQSSQGNQSQVSYSPAGSQQKNHEKKKSGGVSAAVVAVICCVAVLLSGIAGFGGTYLANTLSKGTSVTSPSDNPAVIYRNVTDEVVDSTGSSGNSSLSYSQVAALVKDSVVEITTEYTTRSNWYQYVTKGAGSGVIISDNGYILTNAHVVTGDTSSLADNIQVRLTDGTVYTADVIGYDTDSDIAIIKIEAEGLKAAVCGDSTTLIPGEEILVVGNPLGTLGGSITNGIISATERQISVSGITMNLIQTNAEVSPGNSGGGMFNMKGELVGIINAKSTAEGVEGIGFAIPVNNALDISDQLMNYGYVRGKVYIGAEFEDVSSSYMFYLFDLKPGVYVSSVESGYNDDVLKSGDRVVSVNGTAVSTQAEIKQVISGCNVGDTIEMQIERNGRVLTVNVKCYELIPYGADGVKFNTGN